MLDVAKVLGQKSLVLILAYAPAGLGHLRVTDALYHGLPTGITPLLLGSQDRTLGYLHRVMSVHPLSRSILEWMQRGTPEDIFVFLYRQILHSKTKLLYQQIVTILDERIDLPKTILVISTHFGLAHQIASIKDKLVKEKNVRTVLVVVVTDDSPQHIWYTPRADLTFVPSETTKDKLIEYASNSRLHQIKIEVVAYPISPHLAKYLSDTKLEERKEQLKPSTTKLIHVIIPISGAAVGLTFTREVIEKLYNISDRFKFHVVSKSALYTKNFLSQVLNLKYVELHTSIHDREVVDEYEEVYLKETISLEITKPSEQAFKALLKPTQTGGSILLFSAPVGRQEYENLDFLGRHNLIPMDQEQDFLWNRGRSSLDLSDGQGRQILQESANWRGLRLPDDPYYAADFIWWCLEKGIFKEMLKARVQPKASDPHAHELGFDGVKIFWERVVHYLTREYQGKASLSSP